MLVDDYLKRMQLSQVPAKNSEGLGLLHERHMVTVPFENLDLFLGREIVLEDEAILDKIVRQRRGGCCYELNAAFGWLLRELGFEVDMLAARVAGAEGEFGPEFDHMVLRVRLEDGERLADVGFGDGFIRPLLLDEREQVRLRGQTWLLADQEGTIELRRHERRLLGFVPVYAFDLESRELDDFVEACRRHETEEGSPYRQGRICTSAAPDGRVTLTEQELSVTRNGRIESQPISSSEDFDRNLKRYFGISVGSD